MVYAALGRDLQLEHMDRTRAECWLAWPWCSPRTRPLKTLEARLETRQVVRRSGKDARRQDAYSRTFTTSEGGLTEVFASHMFAPILTLGVIFAMLVAFISEAYPPEVTAMAGALVLLVTGMLPAGGCARSICQSRALDDHGDVHPFGRADADGAALNSVSRIISRHGATHPYPRARIRRRRHDPRLRIHEQHARRGDADPGRGPARANYGSRALQAADPAVLYDDPRRHVHAYRNLDQSAGRWRGPGSGHDTVHALRGDAARDLPRRDRACLHVGCSCPPCCPTATRWPTC